MIAGLTLTRDSRFTLDQDNSWQPIRVRLRVDSNNSLTDS